MEFVFAAEKDIHVVGMRGGYQCFNSTEGADHDMPVVFVDLDGALTVNVRGPHNVHLEPNDCTGDTYVMDNRIALLHEFGHAKQWVETPSMFDNVAPRNGTVAPRWGQARQDQGGGQYDQRLDKADFATDIRNAAAARWKEEVCPKCGEWVDRDLTTNSLLDPKRDKVRHPGALHICRGSRSPGAAIPSNEEVLKYDAQTNPTGYKPPAWGAKIEMDNMSRHEWPICVELGIPPRSNYRDINGESDGDPSLTSQIRRMADIERRKNETLREKILAPGQVQCPHCDYVKSRMFVNNHIRSTHPGEALLG